MKAVKQEKKQTIGLHDDKANAHLIAAAPEMYVLLSEINTAFYTRIGRKEWLALMERTKPLLEKARGEK